MRESAAKSSIESGSDLILVLLYARGSAQALCEDVSDTTRLVKLVYLLMREGGFERLSGDLRFEARDYGPWSGDVFDAIETLSGMGLVEMQRMVPECFAEVADHVEWVVERHVEEGGSWQVPPEEKVKTTCYLTRKGKKAARGLYGGATRSEIARIEFIKAKFNKLNLDDVLRYVHSKYPEHTIKSMTRKRLAR